MEYIKQNKIVWILLTVLISMYGYSPAIGLLIGLGLACVLKDINKPFISKLSKLLLQVAVILLGFKLQFSTLWEVGRNSVFITATTIFIVLSAGYFLGKFLGLDKKLSTLISSGTAICGGSAIAAVAPAINANATQIAISMGIVFVLNAIALLIFPAIGHFLHMSQEQFGIWAAIAIHDTSSVVGATVSYGAKAAVIGTTVKLTRALWVLPIAFFFSKLHKSQTKTKFPMFLIGFVLASIISSYLPFLDFIWKSLAYAGKQMMIGILFLIGMALSPSDIKKIGIKPLITAVLLWLIIAVSSLFIIMSFGCKNFIS